MDYRHWVVRAEPHLSIWGYKPEIPNRAEGDLVDKAIEFIADAKQVAPNKPFYLRFCPGATYAPHHAAKEGADSGRGTSVELSP